jgi:glycosyltransferase involved in cell wall biosynthesis
MVGKEQSLLQELMGRSMVSVSVIILAYNNAQYLGEAIESVFNQTYQDFEIIVVNDGSIDQTHQVAEKYKNKIRYIEQVNRGPSAARNLGINLARGFYLTFMDTDDLFLPDKLMVQVDYLQKHPDIDLVYSHAYRGGTPPVF